MLYLTAMANFQAVTTLNLYETRRVCAHLSGSAGSTADAIGLIATLTWGQVGGTQLPPRPQWFLKPSRKLKGAARQFPRYRE